MLSGTFDWAIKSLVESDKMLKHFFRFSFEVRKLLRVGMALAEPWLYEKRISGLVGPDVSGFPFERTEDGEMVFEGYCFDFLVELATRAKFDYQIVLYDESKSGKCRTSVTDNYCNKLLHFMEDKGF